jgi:hypothetical protein
MAPEELHYILLDEDGNRVATGVHTIEQDGANIVLRTHYESPNGNSDTTTVVVNALTLKPDSSVREIINDNPDDEDRIEVEYRENEVIITAGDRQSGLTVPEHSYDNDTSLFLWRTIAFQEGYEASYVTVITNQRSEAQVILRVPRKETVTVPAGEYEAWRLDIITSNARQTAWYADTPARPLLRYDNDRGVLWELATAP